MVCRENDREVLFLFFIYVIIKNTKNNQDKN